MSAEVVGLQFSISSGVLDVAMAQIMLDRPCVLSVVGEFVAGGVAQHVRVDRKLDAGPPSGPPDDLPHRIGGERRLALADEHVSCIRIVPLQAAQGSQFRSTQRVNRSDAVLEPGDMQQPLAEVDLIPAQTARVPTRAGRGGRRSESTRHPRVPCRPTAAAAAIIAVTSLSDRYSRLR